jgi:siroheme synthase-like protein
VGFYPVVLELGARPVLVVGGGAVAQRKVDGLLEAGARVTVVSPELTERLATWAREDRIRWLGRSYRRGDAVGHALVFVATDDVALNAEIASAARECGVWVNAADDPRHCDFILPSVLRRGPLTVAVSTGGASPALSRMIREELEAHFSDDYGVLASVAAQARRELEARCDGEHWRRALDGEVRRLIAAGQREAAKARLLERLRT